MPARHYYYADITLRELRRFYCFHYAIDIDCMLPLLLLRYYADAIATPLFFAFRRFCLRHYAISIISITRDIFYTLLFCC